MLWNTNTKVSFHKTIPHKISMGERNTILSAYTMYSHLE